MQCYFYVFITAAIMQPFAAVPYASFKVLFLLTPAIGGQLPAVKPCPFWQTTHAYSGSDALSLWIYSFHYPTADGCSNPHGGCEAQSTLLLYACTGAGTSSLNRAAACPMSWLWSEPCMCGACML